MIDYEYIETSNIKDFSVYLDKKFDNDNWELAQQLYAEWRGYCD